MKHLFSPMEIKEVTEAGAFEGVASVYGNIDLGGDIVEPGAFKEFMYTPDGSIRILDGHNTRAPIGKGKLVDTHMGLVVKGQLNLKVSRSRDVHELMKDGIINGLSIGFDVLPGGSKVRDDGVRLLSGLKLWEVSATPFPMNQEALVHSVKELKQITTQREFEDFLRDVGKFSISQAKILSASFKSLPGQRDAEGEAGAVSPETLALLDRIAKTKL